jgi:hypothetical protein
MVVCLSIISGCTSNPVVDVRDHPITWIANVQRDSKLVEEAILLGLVDKGWTGKVVRTGVIKGSILVRGKHRAEVEIFYDFNKYSIMYKSSHNLDYNPKKETIHRNYNRWVLNLQNAIDARLMEAQTDARAG